MESSIEVRYADRVKHIYSQARTNDDELAYGLTIGEPVERIDVKTSDDTTNVDVFTDQGVYHFGTFRADYVGHASRTLVQLLEHFGVRLPIEFVTAHQTFTVFMGSLVAAGEREYPIALRGDVYELVEPVPNDWLISSAVLDTLVDLAKRFSVQPVEIAESATGLFYSILELAEQYDVTPDEIVQTVTTMVHQSHAEPDSSGDNVLDTVPMAVAEQAWNKIIGAP